jgi:MFS-type transporter involved in bile tolerance (Atg22 family)
MPTQSPRAVWSWALYDFANSPFTTLVVTFVYATYFTQAIAADPIHGTALRSRAITATAVVVALVSPLLGAIADRGGYRKALVVAFTWLCIVATVALYFVRPGQVAAALGLVCATALAIAASTKTPLWVAGVPIGVFVGPNRRGSRRQGAQSARKFGLRRRRHLRRRLRLTGRLGHRLLRTRWGFLDRRRRLR